MKIKSIFIILACLCLMGCGSQSTSQTETKKSLYEGLDGQQTYKAAVDYFNQNMTYYKSVTEDEMSQSVMEFFKEDQGVAVVTKDLYYDGSTSMLNYNIVKGNDFHSLFMNDEGNYEYEVMNDYAKNNEMMYQDLSQQEEYEIIDIIREDTDEGIVLTLKVKYENPELEDIEYYLKKINIDINGYIYKENTVYYEDEQFHKALDIEVGTVYSDFNAKQQNEIDDEIDVMISCQGLSDQEVRAKIGVEASFVEK